MKIIIRVTQCVADEVLEEEDRRANPAGEHPFEIADGLPVPKLAAIALDQFFMMTPMACPDHFDVVAENEDGDVLEPDPDHEALSGDPREALDDTMNALLAPRADDAGKRAFPRYPVDWAIHVRSQGIEQHGQAHDISLGGVSLVTDRTLHGEDVLLRIASGQGSIDVEALPVYAIPAETAGRFKIGLRFLSFDGNSRESLAAAIAELAGDAA
ncbi:MAG: PilZ domain-containing protein [Rhodocyclaceae bacterium]|nr:PilZ domain-containing protein [Rhodocyclaceae bacterium]